MYSSMEQPPSVRGKTVGFAPRAHEWHHILSGRRSKFWLSLDGELKLGCLLGLRVDEALLAVPPLRARG